MVTIIVTLTIQRGFSSLSTTCCSLVTPESPPPAITVICAFQASSSFSTKLSLSSTHLLFSSDAWVSTSSHHCHMCLPGFQLVQHQTLTQWNFLWGAWQQEPSETIRLFFYFLTFPYTVLLNTHSREFENMFQLCQLYMYSLPFWTISFTSGKSTFFYLKTFPLQANKIQRIIYANDFGEE